MNCRKSFFFFLNRFPIVKYFVGGLQNALKAGGRHYDLKISKASNFVGLYEQRFGTLSDLLKSMCRGMLREK